jgi:tetratricopeptide (TPR) repeat protein
VRGDFIGRDRELAELLAGFLDATEGRGGVFLITGESGIGKTAIADQLASRATEGGAQVLWGRCWEGGGAPPYWPWAQIIRALAEGRDVESLRSLASSGAADIALLVPELAERLRVSTDRLRPIESDARRFYLFEAVTSFLKAASQAQPVVLVLDDLHDADLPSLLLLRYLISDPRRSRMLVLAAYRETGPEPGTEAEDVLATLAREGTVLGLRGLDRDEVGRLVEQVLGSIPLQDDVTEIYEATEGNPLFVREVTRLLAAQDRLESQRRLRISIPQSVRTVIRRRLSPLSADAIRMLSAAAVAGRDFDLRVVAAASGLASDHVIGSLAEVLALGLVGEEASTAGVYRFSHPLMQEVIYEELPLDVRIQLHRAIGEAIERFHGDDTGPYLAQLAYHFAKVAPVGEGERARDYARRAGDRAMDSCAYEEAVVEYRRALDAFAFASPDEALRCEQVLSLGDALVRAGNYDEAKTIFLSATDIARKLGDAARLARAALGFGEPQVQAGVADRQLMGLLQEALDALSPGDGALRAQILSRLSLELTFSDETELREALSLEALEMARRLGEVVPMASALRARWLAVWGPDGLEERRGLAEDILRLGGATGDRETELIGRARRITCAIEAGDMRSAEVDIAAHADLADELRMPYHQWVAASMRAMRTLLDGSLQAAEERAGAALTMLPGRQDAVFAHLNQITLIRRDQGRLGELRETWRQIVERFPQVGFARGCLCLADAELGRRDDARRGLRSLAEAIGELPRNGVNWLAALAVSSIAAARLQGADAAASVHRLLLPYADRTIVISAPQPVVCFGSASLYVALLEATMSRWQEAEDHFETAIESNTQLGARSLLAYTHVEYTRMLSERGRAGDRIRARDLLDRAAATATALEMDGLLGDIHRLRALDAGTAIAAGAVGNAIRREGDYWTVVFEGSLVRLRDSKGLRYLATLLANPGRELHVLDLESEEHRGAPGPSARRRRSVADEMVLRPDLGDAGELLDATAKAAYKARLEDLEEEVAEAEGFNDPARAAKAKEEIDFIASELARAVGLGGRDRRAAAHAERARLNVTRAIRAAMENLARANPALGRHLSSTIRTGRYCSYTPDPRAEIAWEL